MMQKSKLIMWKSKDEFSIGDPHSKSVMRQSMSILCTSKGRMSVKASQSKLHSATVNMGVVEPT